jgi:hypothetical protein
LHWRAPSYEPRLGPHTGSVAEALRSKNTCGNEGILIYCYLEIALSHIRQRATRPIRN